MLCVCDVGHISIFVDACGHGVKRDHRVVPAPKTARSPPARRSQESAAKFVFCARGRAGAARHTPRDGAVVASTPGGSSRRPSARCRRRVGASPRPADRATSESDDGVQQPRTTCGIPGPARAVPSESWSRRPPYSGVSMAWRDLRTARRCTNSTDVLVATSTSRRRGACAQTRARTAGAWRPCIPAPAVTCAAALRSAASTRRPGFGRGVGLGFLHSCITSILCVCFLGGKSSACKSLARAKMPYVWRAAFLKVAVVVDVPRALLEH